LNDTGQLRCVSPTVFRAAGLRFYFFSREEERLHIHVSGSSGEAKIWLEPDIELARSHGLSPRLVSRALALVREHEVEIRDAWNEHFDS
jgi:hypothetical protein